MTHAHVNKWHELQTTVFKRVTHYYEICACGAVRRCDYRRPVEAWHVQPAWRTF